jgi:hypothetical protein
MSAMLGVLLKERYCGNRVGRGLGRIALIDRILRRFFAHACHRASNAGDGRLVSKHAFGNRAAPRRGIAAISR